MILTLLHPGEMGASLAACARAAGHEVRWVTAGRSAASAARAEAAGLTPYLELSEALRDSDVVLSVCPPHAASGVAASVARLPCEATYVDCNAVSPATARDMARQLGDARFVDGGIIGPPVRRPGTTRLFLSGERAASAAALFDGGPLDCILVDGGAGAASAVKLCYAAWSKGSAALLLAIRALAEHERVAAPLIDEWRRSQPQVVERLLAAAGATPRKAWRFVGEMEEIAATFREAGLPGDFHAGAADLYARLRTFKDVPAADLDTVLRALLGR